MSVIGYALIGLLICLFLFLIYALITIAQDEKENKK